MGYDSETLHAILTDLNKICRLVADIDRHSDALDSVGKKLNSELTKIKSPVYIIISAVCEILHGADPWSVVHQRHVALIGTAIGQDMKWPESDIETVETAALLQDIGKICTPSDFHCREESSVNDGSAPFNKHPLYSYEILKRIECIPEAVSKAVLHHHELIDGSGYPEGLSASGIVREAKILSVADAVDTIITCSNRGSTQGIDFALNEIRKNRGCRYDPVVVDACLAVFQSKKIRYPHII